MKFLLALILLPTLSIAKDFVPSSFSTQYEETSASALNKKKIKKATGTIDYKFAGNIRIEVMTPDKSTAVVNQTKSWYYTPPFGSTKEPGTVTVQKSSKWPLIRLFDSLKNGVESNKLFTHKYVGKELVLTLVSTLQKEIGVKEFHFVSDKDPKAVKSIEEFDNFYMVKTSGPNVNYKFIQFKENASFSADHFTFDIPKNTKVINN